MLAPVAVLLAGCAAFSEPIASGPEGTVDVAGIVGTWIVEPEGPTVALSESGPAELRAVIGDSEAGPDGDRMSTTVQVTAVDGQTVASILVPEPYGLDRAAWILVDVEPSDDGERLTIQPVNSEAILAAIESGELEGTVEDLPDEEEWAGVQLIEADGQDLRAFLTGRPETFSAGDAGDVSDVGDADGEPIVLRRIEVSTESDVTPEAGSDGSGAGTGRPGDSLGPDAAMPLWATSDPYAMPTFGYPEPVPTSYLGMDPLGGAASTDAGGSMGEGDAGADAAMPPGIKNLIMSLVALLVVGVVAAAAIDHLRRAAGDGSKATDTGSTVAGGAADAGPNAGATVTDAGWRATDDTASVGSARSALRRNAWPAVLALAVVVGPILYLAVLLLDLADPGAGLGQTSGAQALLYGFAPFVLVCSVGALIGAAEVIATFPDVAVEAMSTRWAALLVLTNAFAIVVVFSVAASGLQDTRHPLAWSFAIALGFIVLMRTRFVFARDLSGLETREGVSIDTGWVYGRFQRVCRQRIDDDLMRRPLYAAERLLSACPDTSALVGIVEQAIAGQDPAGAEETRRHLDAILAEGAPLALARARLAQLVVESLGVDDVRILVAQPEQPPVHVE